MKCILPASVLLLTACATVDAAPRARSAGAGEPGLAVSDATTGFLIAVMDGCAAAAAAGKTLEQLNSPLVVRDDTRTGASAPRAGYAAWAPANAKGVVMIDEGAADCTVSAYGIPVELSFAAIANKLAERGYVSVATPPQGFKQYASQMTRQVDGKTVSVVLSGNEPGAPGTLSRFSTALGIVRVTTP